MEMVFVALLPTVTLPKPALAGLTDSCGVGAATPEPVSGRIGLLAALLANEIWPEALPTDAGANCAV